MKLKPGDMMDDNDRTIPFEPDFRCDICNAIGAYDFMGDYICPKCLSESMPYVEDNDDDEYTQRKK